MRHCDSVVLDVSPLGASWLVQPMFETTPGTPWIPRDFPWPPESSSVHLNVDVHVVVLPYHQRTLSHVLLIVVAQPKSDLSAEF